MAAPLEGKVVWLAGVGGAGGRDGKPLPDRARDGAHAAALLLAARGASVLVSGGDERALGACVGEIAHGGGRAKHVVATLRTADEVRACLEAARARFGGLDVAVFACASGVSEAGELEDVARAVDVARDAIRRGGRIVLLVAASPGEPRVAPFVREVARLFAPRGITCNAVLLGDLAPAIRAAEPEDVAELVVFLSSSTGAVVTGATLTAS